jgi:hypothetical protein
MYFYAKDYLRFRSNGLDHDHPGCKPVVTQLAVLGTDATYHAPALR